MKLSAFLNSLFGHGAVTVPRSMAGFDDADLQQSVGIIRDFYETDRLEMAYPAPAFCEGAALWAAQYLFYAVQLVLMRDVEADEMADYLKQYAGEQDAEAIYSVDLVFRHLAPLFKFSSGISPDDPLVASLKQTAALWPYSSVGLSIVPIADTSAILANPALKYAYLDKIILHRDLNRMRPIAERAAFTEIAGIHQELLWPGLILADFDEQLI